MAKRIFEQTNRTMLFEEINSEKLDLLTLIGSGKGLTSLDDEKINEIHHHLLVRNFDEFLEKFEPKVFSFFNASNQKIRYSLEKPQGIPDNAITEIPLGMDNTLFKMLSTLIDSKKAAGSKNVDFDFASILNMLSPKKVMDDIKQLRKEISYLHEKYESLENADPLKLEYGDKLNLNFDKASQNYNNILGMLPLAIEDIKSRILIGQNEGDKKSEEIKIGMLTMDEHGELKIIENKNKKGKELAIIDKKSHSLAKYFEEDYEIVNEEPNDYVKSLVVRTFAPMATLSEDVNVPQEVKNYNNYLTFYKEAQEDFIKTIKPLLEKMIGVKVFFEQYDKELKGMRPALIITNIKLEMLLKGENKNVLNLYLNTVNQKNDFEHTIWFGIVPTLHLEEIEKKKGRAIFAGTNKVEKLKGNTIENLQLLMTILGKYKVNTFFSVSGSDETTFNNLATIGVEKYVEKTRNLQYKEYSEYLIPCIPNFTIIPKEKSSVILDYKLILDESELAQKDKDDIVKFWIEGVYIEGSYVAAGITAAYQCPDYLKKRYKKVNMQEPGVRINIESNDNTTKIATTMAKEITGYTVATKDSINRNNFGFVFSSDNVQSNGKTVSTITVYKARTLATNDEGVFEPLYKTLTTTFIERTLRFMTTDFKEDKIKDFFSNRPDSQKNKWLNDQKNINSIMQEGDDISMGIEGNDCFLHINFNGNVKNLTVDITKN